MSGPGTMTISAATPAKANASSIGRSYCGVHAYKRELSGRASLVRADPLCGRVGFGPVGAPKRRLAAAAAPVAASAAVSAAKVPTSARLGPLGAGVNVLVDVSCGIPTGTRHDRTCCRGSAGA